MSSKEQYDEDMSVYHPHDLLIAKSFPDEDLPSIGYDSMEYLALYEISCDKERFGQEPCRIPWPLPPLRPRESQEAGVEQWRSKALQAIDSRVAMFTSASVPQPTLDTSIPQPSISPIFAGPVHRLLLIPEMLELILRQATPETQHTAWNVNRLWRSTLEHILAYQYRSCYPCPPVEYGDRIRMDPNIPWITPSNDELALVEQEVAGASRKSLQELTKVYYPARVAQAISLSEEAYSAIATSYERLRWKSPESNPIDQGRRWLDLSQFKINAHIAELFGSRMEAKLGRYEIALKAGANQPCLLRGSLPDGKFSELIADMFLTEPPCKALGVYVDQPHQTILHRLGRICDEDGIRVGQFLDALQHHASELLSRWLAQAGTIRKGIAALHWTSFSTAEQMRQQWLHHGCPKFVILFEQTCEGPATLTHNAYTYGEDYCAVRASEWFCNTGSR